MPRIVSGVTHAGVAHPADLIRAAQEGDTRAVARLISLVEDDSPDVPEVMAALAELGADAGVATIIGVTGAPGVGKSTLASGLVRIYLQSGLRVGVLLVDPTSPWTGGALLGDRIRLQEHATNPAVFIRSMATRGRLGGLAWATPRALWVLEAAGYQVILLETVGVGQAEVDVVRLADTTTVVLAPGMGDAIQLAKAGVVEAGDVYVVNKADNDGAERLRRDLRSTLSPARPGRAEPVRSGPGGHWRPPIVSTVAVAGMGLSDLVAALDRHRTYLDDRGELERRRAARAHQALEPGPGAGSKHRR